MRLICDLNMNSSSKLLGPWPAVDLQSSAQVFDSGSSCSNEECWEVDEKGGKVKVNSSDKSVKQKMSEEVTKLEPSPEVVEPPVSRVEVSHLACLLFNHSCYQKY